jgi:uncharacterized SAM-binding protein YcdF (DUF218 family)
LSFILSKIGWTLVQPSNLLWLLLFLGSILLIAGRRAAGTWLTAGATAALTIVGVLPIGAWLLLPLENRFSANPPLPTAIDGIIALGGGIDLEISAVRDQLAMDEAAERLLMLVTLGRRYPDARLAFTGGSGELFGRTSSEAAVVKQALRGLGADLERVVFEDRSRNTFENAHYSKDLLEPKLGECWLLITSAHHIARAVGVFERVGWDVVPYPVDYRTTGTEALPGRLDVARRMQEFDLAVHSWLGLLAYHLMDRSSGLLPKGNAAACSSEAAVERDIWEFAKGKASAVPRVDDEPKHSANGEYCDPGSTLRKSTRFPDHGRPCCAGVGRARPPSPADVSGARPLNPRVAHRHC